MENYSHKPERLFYGEADPVACSILGLTLNFSLHSEIEDGLNEFFECDFHSFEKVIPL
ncbi:hypothetical protein LV84_00004 [Algoriphagus ratkowskyi]|uniref:Uncharacterized protein n=1 Tax=Algoriphagus ratkowskyi TaxID=57028 RepID=A0A2W7RQ03_9BACT|nr:hypothetical protein LV84_00004 [Algoriphagus ratkowskyi]